jgi:hypothetical protein
MEEVEEMHYEYESKQLSKKDREYYELHMKKLKSNFDGATNP